jgi:hypothetical protein
MTESHLYTEDHVDAALCIWEYCLLLRNDTDDDSVFDWLRGGEGAATARNMCIQLAKDCDRSYTVAAALGYDDSFDWEFVPRWVTEAMHISEFAGLEGPWIDYIGRRIYDEFRLEHERLSR